jgi:hypothetical protein
MRHALGAILLLVVGSAQAAVIDFQSLESPTSMTAISTYTEDGYTFDPNGGTFAVWGTSDGNYAGSTALIHDDDLGITTLTGPGAFNLTSVDLSEAFAVGGVVSVTFERDGGHSQVFNLDGTFGFETFFFDAGFNGTSSLSWSQEADFYQLDNLAVNAVPIPAAVWLFGSALGALGWVFRRKTV